MAERDTKGLQQRVAAHIVEHGAVTKSDSTVLDFDGLYVGTAGNVAIEIIEDEGAVTYNNVQDGTFIPIKGVRVYSTGTTASNIVWVRTA